MAQLTQWLELMLDEIARKREDARQAAEELAQRATTATLAREQPAAERTPSRQAKAARRARGP